MFGVFGDNFSVTFLHLEMTYPSSQTQTDTIPSHYFICPVHLSYLMNKELLINDEKDK